MIWTQMNFGGVSPKGIANHKGIVDNNGRIIIFGGYNVLINNFFNINLIINLG